MTNLFIAKLDFGVNNAQLQSHFETVGKVVKCNVVLDKETGKSRGFAFLEMSSAEEAQRAIDELDGSEINGRRIAVKIAEDKGGRGGDRSEGAPRGPRPDFNRDAPRGGRFEKSSDAAGARPSGPPREYPRANSFEAPGAMPDFETAQENRRKETIKKKDKPKTHKMEAYKKSGKNNDFLDDEDWEDDLDLFGRGEDDDLDENYKKYVVNSNEEEEDDWDEEEDWDGEDEEN